MEPERRKKRGVSWLVSGSGHRLIVFSLSLPFGGFHEGFGKQRWQHTEIIRDEAIAAPLLANAAPDDDEGAPTVARGREQGLEVERVLVLRDLGLDGVADLGVLVLHNGIVDIAGAVILCEDVKRRLFLAPAAEPPG